MRTLIAALAAVLLLAVLAACTESDDDSAADDVAAEAATATAPPDDPDPTATAEPEATPEPEPTEAPTPDPDDDGDDEPTEHIISVNDNFFDPEDIEISAGDTITWVNEGGLTHTSTLDPEIARDEDNAVLPDGADTWDSGDMEPGDEFSITLDVPGEYIYFCRPHEAADMVGTITVNGNGADDEDAAAPDDDQSDDDETDDDEVDDYL